MAWYMILLIIIASIIGLIILWKFLKLITKPKFKNNFKFEKNQEAEIKSVENNNSKPDVKGLSLDAHFDINDDEEVQETDEEVDRRRNMFAKFNKDFHSKSSNKKTLLDEINSLSPELKAMLFDRGLARKDYDFKSKKD